MSHYVNFPNLKTNIVYADDAYIPKVLDDVMLINKMYNNTTNINDKEKDLLRLVKKHKDHYMTYYILGNFYQSNGKYEDMIKMYNESIVRNDIKTTHFVDAYLALAVYLYKTDYKKALTILFKCNNKNPENYRILNLIGVIFHYNDNYEFALKYYNETINVAKSKNEEHLVKGIYNNMGVLYIVLGDYKKGIDNYKKSFSLYKKVNFKTEVDGSEQYDAMIHIKNNELVAYDYLFDIPPPDDIYKSYLELSDVLNVRNKYKFISKYTKKKTGLNIGFVSGDLNNHVVFFFLKVVLNAIDKRFNIFMYSNNSKNDEITEYLKNRKDITFRNVYESGKFNGSSKAYNMITGDKIDILMDISGNTTGNRLDIFALKPAPIQMTWMGYSNTTGITNIDYIITDKYASPEDSKQIFSEKKIYMPRCFVCFYDQIFRNDGNALVEVPERKCDEDKFVFGILNKIEKCNAEVFDAIGQILDKTQNSIIYLKYKDNNLLFKEKYKDFFEKYKEKIVPIKFTETFYDYMNLYNKIDCMLDTFPYSGTTTTGDSLIMSTPVITYAIKDRFASNVTRSILLNLNHPELVSYSKEEYINKAVEMTKDYDKIINYKMTLRDELIKESDCAQYCKEWYDLIYDTYQKHQF
jgi:predicted O-linked N-acetylglucosamine transferase (SPINDLY family)